MTLKSTATISPTLQKGRNPNPSCVWVHVYVFVSTFIATLKILLNALISAQNVQSLTVSTTLKIIFLVKGVRGFETR